MISQAPDAVSRFLHARCIQDLHAKSVPSELHNAYACWAKQDGAAPSLTLRKLSQILNGCGFASRKSNGVRYICGIEVVPGQAERPPRGGVWVTATARDGIRDISIHPSELHALRHANNSGNANVVAYYQPYGETFEIAGDAESW